MLLTFKAGIGMVCLHGYDITRLLYGHLDNRMNISELEADYMRIDSLYGFVIVSTYLSGRNSTYVGMESPPINLSGCDWTAVMINLFNKF